MPEPEPPTHDPAILAAEQRAIEEMLQRALLKPVEDPPHEGS
jgi:hypothetical protein